MRKLGNHMSHRVRLILALLSLLILLALSGHMGGWPLSVQAITPQTANPSWTLIGNLKSFRSDFTVTLLPNGKVLVAGGGTGCGGGWLNSTEIYDPATRTWSYSGNLGIGRRNHTATLLPNGKVLVAGGEVGSDQFTNSAELYDPANGRWRFTGNLNSAAVSHTATLLANGKV